MPYNLNDFQIGRLLDHFVSYDESLPPDLQDIFLDLLEAKTVASLATAPGSLSALTPLQIQPPVGLSTDVGLWTSSEPLLEGPNPLFTGAGYLRHGPWTQQEPLTVDPSQISQPITSLIKVPVATTEGQPISSSLSTQDTRGFDVLEVDVENPNTSPNVDAQVEGSDYHYPIGTNPFNEDAYNAVKAKPSNTSFEDAEAPLSPSFQRVYAGPDVQGSTNIDSGVDTDTGLDAALATNSDAGLDAGLDVDLDVDEVANEFSDREMDINEDINVHIDTTENSSPLDSAPTGNAGTEPCALSNDVDSSGEEDDDADEDYNVHKVGKKKRPRPRPSSKSKGKGMESRKKGGHEGGGGGGGGGNGGGGNAANWDPDCRRGSGWFNVILGDRAAAREANNANLNIDVEFAALQTQASYAGPQDSHLADGPSSSQHSRHVRQAPTPENQVLTADTIKVLTKLANLCRKINDGTNSSKCSDVTDILGMLAGSQPEFNVSTAFTDNSLEAIAKRVDQAHKQVSRSTFILFLNLIHFRLKIESMVQSSTNPKMKRTSILASLEIKRSKETLGRWFRNGSACTLLAGAGSIYLLVIAACAEIKSSLERMPLPQMIRMMALLRCPTPDTPEGLRIIQDIIPAVAKLRNQVNIQFSTMFSVDSISTHGQPAKIQSVDFEQSDAFFDSIKFDCFVKARDYFHWSSCLGPPENLLSTQADHTFNQHLLANSTYILPPVLSGSPLSILPARSSQVPASSPTHVPSSPPSLPMTVVDDETEYEDVKQPTLPYTDEELIVINTNFDPKKNKVYAPGRNLSHEEVFEYTECERAKAERAVVPTSMDDLTAKLQHQVVSGVKQDPTAYIRMTPDLYNKDIICVKDINHDPLVIVDPTLGSKSRNELILDFCLLFPELENTDTQEKGIYHVYKTLHFTWYNRYCTHLPLNDPNINPVTVDPAIYQWEGKRKVNSAMYIPKASREIQENPQLYELLSETLEPVLTWQSLQLEALLPQHYSRLAEYANCLPGNERLPAYPFAGMVINLNAATRVHRDWDDQDLCMVIVISDCQGGALVLMELGLVIDLRNGDMVVFRSSLLTHFNLHFTGKRASLVFHTDRAAASWTENRNNWAQNEHFRST